MIDTYSLPNLHTDRCTFFLIRLYVHLVTHGDELKGRGMGNRSVRRTGRTPRRRWWRSTVRTVIVATVGALTLSVAPPAGADPSCANNDPKFGFCVGGKILEEYYAAGNFGFFGNATNSELGAAGNGRWQPFEKGSSIYWNANVAGGRANQVGGLIRDKWGQLGWEGGALLGYPIQREAAAVGGRFSLFERGSIYWSIDSNAHQIGGVIRDKWGQLGWESGEMGFPTTDESPASNGWRFNHFLNGSIYWSSTRGAIKVNGPMRAGWKAQDWERGQWGFPVQDTVECATDANVNGAYGGWGQKFDGGWKFNQTNVTTSSGWTKAPGYNAVNSARQLRYSGTTKYSSNLNAAVGTWNGQNRVALTSVAAGAGNGATLLVDDYNEPGSKVVAFYRNVTEPYVDLLRFNDAYMSGYGTDLRTNVATHELGHALGLGHSCSNQVMGPFASNITTLGDIDKDSYQNYWR
jgi:hypothetical protein